MADNLNTFMCRLSWNPGASAFWNPQGLSRPVMGLLYLLTVWSATCSSNYLGIQVIQSKCLRGIGNHPRNTPPLPSCTTLYKLSPSPLPATDLQPNVSWFQTSAMFWTLYAFFWVIPRSLNFICRRFGTLFHLHKQVGVHLPAYEDGTECSETSAYKIQTPGNYPEESIQQPNFSPTAPHTPTP